MENLFLIRGEGYNDFIPLFTTALNSKPETVIRKYKERFSIEITNKELKSYLNVEGSYFRTKESNYAFFFLLCLVYNLVQCMHAELPDMSGCEKRNKIVIPLTTNQKQVSHRPLPNTPLKFVDSIGYAIYRAFSRLSTT